MSRYPIIGDFPTPWLDVREVAIEVSVNGTNILAVPSQDAIAGDIDLGAGFEGEAPYILCKTSDLEPLGELHGLPVIVGDRDYVVRNVRPKININMTRLVLDRRRP